MMTFPTFSCKLLNVEPHTWYIVHPPFSFKNIIRLFNENKRVFFCVIASQKLLKWQHSYLATADKLKEADDRRAKLT